MKCPKCGYISFDYNQVCPKCNKNIADEQAKLNIPSFRPNPPSLLGILTGEADESNVGLQTDTSESMMDSHEMDISMDEPVGIATSELALDEEHDMEDISLGHEDSGDFELSGGEEISIGEPSEISDEETESFAMPSDEEEGEEISLDLGDVSLEEDLGEEISATEEITSQEGEEGTSLDEVSVLDSTISEEAADEETVISPETVDLEIDKEIAGEERSEVELNLDELKINETGELEIGKPPEPVEVTKEDSLDLGDLSLDDSGPAAEEEPLDLGEISLDEPGSDDDKTKVYDETLSVDESGLEAMMDESQSDISLDISEDQGSAQATEDEMSLDLDNLDLDLDLDEPEDK